MAEMEETVQILTDIVSAGLRSTFGQDDAPKVEHGKDTPPVAPIGTPPNSSELTARSGRPGRPSEGGLPTSIGLSGEPVVTLELPSP